MMEPQNGRLKLGFLSLFKVIVNYYLLISFITIPNS
jgi:hypothetical protein